MYEILPTLGAYQAYEKVSTLSTTNASHIVDLKNLGKPKFYRLESNKKKTKLKIFLSINNQPLDIQKFILTSATFIDYKCVKY